MLTAILDLSLKIVSPPSCTNPPSFTNVNISDEKRELSKTAHGYIFIVHSTSNIISGAQGISEPSPCSEPKP